MKFEQLVLSTQKTHDTLQESAFKAINKHLTIRNWLIGLYIVEFEQKGDDRAKYGEKLLQNLAQRLATESLSYRNLKLFRQFYATYPQIGKVVEDFLETYQDAIFLLPEKATKKLQNNENQSLTIWQSTIAKFKAMPDDPMQVPPHKLISRLSYTHLVQLLPIESSLKRTFYEIEVQ